MFHKILAAIALSKTGRRVFEEAFNLAKTNGGSLMLLHVLSPDEEGCPDISQLYTSNYYFPVLVWMYVGLARREEREVRAEFGEEYARYAATTPGFFPAWGGKTQRNSSN